MSRLTPERGRPDAYRIVVAARPVGATIGRYRGFPIPERVVDQFGRFFTYVGVIDRTGDGQYDVEALKPGEFIVEPGLVYGLEAGSRRSVAAPQPSPRAPIGRLSCTSQPRWCCSSRVLWRFSSFSSFFISYSFVLSLWRQDAWDASSFDGIPMHPAVMPSRSFSQRPLGFA
jgi:hypothetical protein